jgi:hypothetical protein
MKQPGKKRARVARGERPGAIRVSCRTWSAEYFSPETESVEPCNLVITGSWSLWVASCAPNPEMKASFYGNYPAAAILSGAESPIGIAHRAV